jgi:hypothetical protein
MPRAFIEVVAGVEHEPNRNPSRRGGRHGADRRFLRRTNRSLPQSSSASQYRKKKYPKHDTLGVLQVIASACWLLDFRGGKQGRHFYRVVGDR